MRAVAVIDGEHYAPVVRAALAELPYEFVAASLAGGTREAARRRGLRRAARRPASRRRSRRAPRSSSTSPTSRCSARPSGCRSRAGRSPAGLPYVGRRLPLRAARVRPFGAAVARRGRDRASGWARRRSRRTSRGCSRATATCVVVAMGRGGPPEPEVVETPPTIADLLALLARRAGTPPPTISRRQRSPACRRSAAGAAAAASRARRASRTCRRGRGSRPSAVPDIVVFDGSGAAIPPVASTARVLWSPTISLGPQPVPRADQRPRALDDRRGRRRGEALGRRALRSTSACGRSSRSRAGDALFTTGPRRCSITSTSVVFALAEPGRPRRAATRPRRPRRGGLPRRAEGGGDRRRRRGRSSAARRSCSRPTTSRRAGWTTRCSSSLPGAGVAPR